MAERLLYAEGVDAAICDWETGDWQWVLATIAAPTPVDSPSFNTLDSALGGDEFTATGYAREALTGAAKTVATGPSGILLECDNPNFGALTGGQTASWLFLAQDTGDDSTSLMVGAYEILYVANGAAALFSMPANGPVAVTFSCPAEV